MNQAQVMELLTYEFETGVFKWAKDKGLVKAGATAGSSRHHSGYVFIKINDKSYAAHRLAWLCMHGSWPARQIDHINGNKSDNRIENLRDVTQEINQQNGTRPRKDNKLGIRGVSRHGKGFRVAIHLNGKQQSVGTFKTIEEAEKAYWVAKLKIHPGVLPEPVITRALELTGDMDSEFTAADALAEMEAANV